MDKVIFSASADEIMDSLERNCGINVIFLGGALKSKALWKLILA